MWTYHDQFHIISGSELTMTNFTICQDLNQFYTLSGSDFTMTIFTPYKDPTVSYEGHWHLITCMFEIENYDDLAVKAVTGSYENYWHLMPCLL